MAIRISSIPPILTPLPANRPAETPAETAREFGDFLRLALAKVEQSQTDASRAAQQLATGEIKDVAEVMIASEKASLSLQLTIQVRNKLLEAYQEIMRMPV